MKPRKRVSRLKGRGRKASASRTVKVKVRKVAARPAKRRTARRPRTGPRLTAAHVVEIDEERERAGGNERAFDLDSGGGVDGIAEELGEGYVLSVTSGEQAAEDIRDQEWR